MKFCAKTLIIVRIIAQQAKLTTTTWQQIIYIFLFLRRFLCGFYSFPFTCRRDPRNESFVSSFESSITDNHGLTITL
jgi:hypothetical protein